MVLEGKEFQNIQTRAKWHHQAEIQFLPMDSDGDRDDFLIYQLLTDVPESMARLVEEKLNSSKGIQFNFLNLYILRSSLTGNA